MTNVRNLNIPELHEIASITRNDFLDGNISDEYLMQVAECDEENVRRTRRWLTSIYRTPFPRHHCGLASYALIDRLGFGEYVHGIYDTELDGFRHTAVYVGETALGEGTIVDITADQFGGPEIYIGPVVKPWNFLIGTEKAVPLG